MRVLRTLVLVCVILRLTPSTMGQGCSDAGVCTAGPLGDISITSDSGALGFDHRHTARMTFSYAIGEQGTVILQAVPELDLRVSPRLRLQARVPFMSISGDLGNNSGVGDPLVTASYAVMHHDAVRLDVLVGAKFNSGKATATDDRIRTLPMPYQTSLGTRDLLLGVNYKNRRFTAGLAYQHVLVNNNKNGYLHLFWMDSAEGQAYFESAGLVRADDAVARIQYAFPIGRLVLQPGLLAIQHLTEDQRTEVDQFGSRLVQVDGSRGLTLNITADARLPISKNVSLEGSFGTPVITRDVRPDGLTRSLVMNLGVRYAF